MQQEDSEGLTEAQFHALRFLHTKQGLVMRDVANGLGFSYAAGTKTIDRLVQKGLVERVPDKDDGRQVRVGLTERGTFMAEQLKRKATQTFQRVLQAMPPEEVDRLGDALQGFLRHFIQEFGDTRVLCEACGYEDGLDCVYNGECDCLVQETSEYRQRVTAAY